MNTSPTPSTEGGTLYGFAREQKDAGVDSASLTQMLIERGMTPDRAAEMVKSLYGSPGKAAGVNAAKVVGTGTASLMRSMLGGIAAAVAGGFMWGLAVRMMHIEIGYMAIGVGVLTGFVTLWATPDEHREGGHIPFVAVAASLLGIFIGKYATFWLLVSEQSHGEYSSLNALTLAGPVVFFSALPEIIDFFDFIWMILACSAAYRIAAQELS